MDILFSSLFYPVISTVDLFIPMQFVKTIQIIIMATASIPAVFKIQLNWILRNDEEDMQCIER